MQNYSVSATLPIPTTGDAPITIAFFHRKDALAGLSPAVHATDAEKMNDSLRGKYQMQLLKNRFSMRRKLHRTRGKLHLRCFLSSQM
jgi:hypothetical protein